MHGNQVRRGNSSLWIFLIFLIVGVYFLNLALSFLTIPATLTANVKYVQAINFVAGVLLIIGGFKFLLSRKPAY